MTWAGFAFAYILLRLTGSALSILAAPEGETVSTRGSRVLGVIAEMWLVMTWFHYG